MGRVAHSKRLAPSVKLNIRALLWTRPVPTGRLWDVRVVVLLVDGRDGGRSIDNGNSQRACSTDQPVVPPRPPYGERWQVGERRLTRENEVVDPQGTDQFSSACDSITQFAIPLRIAERNRCSEVCVPTPSCEQELTHAHTMKRADEVGEKNDVCVGVREQTLGRHRSGDGEGRRDEQRPLLRSLDLSNVPRSDLGRCLRHTILITEEDTVDSVKSRPALQRVPLNQPDVRINGLGILKMVIT